MRMHCVLALAVVLLAGCTDADWSEVVGSKSDPPVNADPPTADPPAAARAGISAATDRYCQTAAKARENDVAVQGFEDGIQRAAYDKTYGDCVYWAVRR